MNTSDMDDELVAMACDLVGKIIPAISNQRDAVMVVCILWSMLSDQSRQLADDAMREVFSDASFMSKFNAKVASVYARHGVVPKGVFNGTN